jgi:tetratricopeptide (TPR) repeat protein
MADLFESLKSALNHHQTGRSAEAETLYRSVLAEYPEQPYALYLYGLLCLGLGRLDQAIDLLTRAAAGDPERTDALLNLGNALLRRGDIADAAERYREVIERRPGLAEGFANYARALQLLGRTEDAIDAGRKAIALKPSLVEAQINLGTAFLAAGRFTEAINSFKAALALKPDAADTHVNLANAYQRDGQHEIAVATVRRALDLKPDLSEAHSVLGSALRELGQLAAAETALRRAMELKPGNVQALTNLGNVLFEQDRLAEAETIYRQAIAAAPDLIEAHSNLGHVLISQGRLPDGIAACQRAIDLRPDFAEAHWNQGFGYLLAGDFAQGWEKYEWRKRHPRFAAAYRHFPQPTWEGQDLTGKTLLMHAEQGLGDSLQLIRYARPLAEGGARVIVACDRPLMPLFASVKGVSAAVDRAGALPSFDLWVDQMSLPRVMGTRVETIPDNGAYLAADPVRIQAWARELPAGRKIGIVWAGNPTHSNDRRRSLPVAFLRKWLEVPGVSFVSLQVGARAQEIELLKPLPITDLAGRLSDFMETAAVVANLDLVISVDTAVAHLAGGLGKPVWVALPFAPDWRWILGRDDSPWYRSMRLFRQTRAGDWTRPTEEITQQLQGFRT